MSDTNLDIIGLKNLADSQFTETYTSIQKATDQRERLRNEAWVTHYADDSDIGLRIEPVVGGVEKIVFELSADFTSEMIVSLPPAHHGLLFQHYVKGPDSIEFEPSRTMDQTAIAKRFVVLVGRAKTALMM